MVVQISQNTMDFLVSKRDQLVVVANQATNEVTAAQAKKTGAQRGVDDANAVIADCVVVP